MVWVIAPVAPPVSPKLPLLPKICWQHDDESRRQGAAPDAAEQRNKIKRKHQSIIQSLGPYGQYIHSLGPYGQYIHSLGPYVLRKSEKNQGEASRVGRAEILCYNY